MGGRSGRKQPTKEVAIEFPPGVDKKHVDRYASILFEPPVSVMSYSTLFWKPYSQHMTDIVNRAVMVSKGKIWSFRQEYVRFAAMKNNEAAEKLKLRQPDESKCQKTGSKLDSDDSSEDEDDADDDTDDENNSKKLEIPKKPPFQPPFPHDSPPLEVFERFCDLLGEHEPSNRFLLLRDGPVSDHPFVSSEGEDNLTEQHCCHCIINDSLDWLCERDPAFDKCRINSCDDAHPGSTFPCTYEALTKHAERHAERSNKYCIFHKLIVVYLRTLVELEEKNRKSNKDFHLCGSTEQVIDSIDFPSSNTESKKIFFTKQSLYFGLLFLIRKQFGLGSITRAPFGISLFTGVQKLNVRYMARGLILLGHPMRDKSKSKY